MPRIAPDLEYYAEIYAAQDTVAWDDVHERAIGTARRTGYAQIILERGHARYRLVDIRDHAKLRNRRLRGCKVHVITA